MRVPAEEPAVLTYIEQRFGEAYRLQLAQEESIWRSLPVLAIAASVQLAGLGLAGGQMPARAGITANLALALLGLAGVLTMAALGCLIASIYPRPFEYVASEPELLDYAQTLIQREQAQARLDQEDPFSAVVTLKMEMARQYASAADHNRRINQRREQHRSLAALILLAAMNTSVLLAGTLCLHHILDC